MRRSSWLAIGAVKKAATKPSSVFIADRGSPAAAWATAPRSAASTIPREAFTARPLALGELPCERSNLLGESLFREPLGGLRRAAAHGRELHFWSCRQLARAPDELGGILPEEPRLAVADDLDEPSTADHERDCAGGHGLDDRHPEVLEVLRTDVLVDAVAGGVPVEAGVAVEPAQLAEIGVDVKSHRKAFR